jgi:hypothetical protein
VRDHSIAPFGQPSRYAEERLKSPSHWGMIETLSNQTSQKPNNMIKVRARDLAILPILVGAAHGA